MKTLIARTFAFFFLTGIASLHAQVPQIINYQGRVTTGTPPVNFDGAGQFKFALVDGGGAGVPATATAMVGSGRVTAINVTAGGYGYLTPPVVTITPVLGFGSGATATAQVANGAVSAITVNTTGTGYTATPLVSIAPPAAPVFTTYWSNDGTSTLGLPPSGAVALPVVKGLYSVLLGNTALGNMTAIPATVFGNADVRLRVWFNDGVNGFQLLSPDQRIAAVGYALMAAGVPDGAIGTPQLAEGAVTSAKLAEGAVTSTKLAAGAVGSAQLAANAVQTSNIAANAITATQLAAGAVGSTQLAANAVQTGNIAANAITSAKLAAGAVGSTQLAAGAVQTANIAANAITTAQLAAGAVGSTQLAAGAVGSTQLATNAVQSANIAAGAITSSQIASGAVGFGSLAKPPQSGTVSSTALFHDFGGSSFTVNFPQSYAATPVVTLSLASSSAAFPSAVTAQVTSSNAALFNGKVATFAPSPITVDATATAGHSTSLAIVNGSPAMSYHGASPGPLKFVRAGNANGTSWGTPITVASTDGAYCSLAVVGGYPAIAYYDTTTSALKYVRATNASGTAWGTPITVDSTSGAFCSLAVVYGSNPAIAYYDTTNGHLKFVMANNETGTAWGASLTVDSAGVVGLRPSLAMVDGNPAISYFDATNTVIKYVRATEGSFGSAWGAPFTIGAATISTLSSSLAVVNGHPAISYSAGPLKYVRATNASGTAWGVAVTLDSTGDYVGISNSLAVVNGNPAISYLHLENFSSAGTLRYVRATNANGTAWAAPITLDSTGGSFCSLAEINGKTAVGYRTGKLDFITANPPVPFQVNWIALPP